MTREKKAARLQGKLGLAAAGIGFESKNKGAHLIVTPHRKPRIDFWPGTGKWREPYAMKDGQGLGDLLQWIKSRPEVA